MWNISLLCRVPLLPRLFRHRHISWPLAMSLIPKSLIWESSNPLYKTADCVGGREGRRCDTVGAGVLSFSARPATLVGRASPAWPRVSACSWFSRLVFVSFQIRPVWFTPEPTYLPKSWEFGWARALRRTCVSWVSGLVYPEPWLVLQTGQVFLLAILEDLFLFEIKLVLLIAYTNIEKKTRF